MAKKKKKDAKVAAALGEPTQKENDLANRATATMQLCDGFVRAAGGRDAAIKIIKVMYKK